MSRNQLRIQVAIATGHCNLNYHLANEGYIEEKKCRDCQEEDETPYHLAFECERHECTRQEVTLEKNMDTISLATKILKKINRYDIILNNHDPP